MRHYINFDFSQTRNKLTKAASFFGKPPAAPEVQEPDKGTDAGQKRKFVLLEITEDDQDLVFVHQTLDTLQARLQGLMCGFFWMGL